MTAIEALPQSIPTGGSEFGHEPPQVDLNLNTLDAQQEITPPDVIVVFDGDQAILPFDVDPGIIFIEHVLMEKKENDSDPQVPIVDLQIPLAARRNKGGNNSSNLNIDLFDFGWIDRSVSLPFQVPRTSWDS